MRARMLYILSSILLLILFTYMVFKAHHDQIHYQTIYDEQLPERFEGFQVFFIADIHRRKINDKTLQSIQEKIDIVLIGGDLTEKGVPIQRTQRNIQKLKTFEVPIIFVWGNNDYEVPSAQLIKLLKAENVIVLKDTLKRIVRNEDIISIVGFDYYKDNHDAPKFNWQETKGSYTILLTHKPSSFYHLTKKERHSIHTVLAGHTHGGQIRFFRLGLYQRGGLDMHQGTNIFKIGRAH